MLLASALSASARGVVITKIKDSSALILARHRVYIQRANKKRVPEFRVQCQSSRSTTILAREFLLMLPSSGTASRSADDETCSRHKPSSVDCEKCIPPPFPSFRSFKTLFPKSSLLSIAMPKASASPRSPHRSHRTPPLLLFALMSGVHCAYMLIEIVPPTKGLCAAVDGTGEASKLGRVLLTRVPPQIALQPFGFALEHLAAACAHDRTPVGVGQGRRSLVW